MNEAKRQQRNIDRRATLFPTFDARIARVIQSLEAAGLRPRIQEAWRSEQEQLEKFKAGFSQLKFGFHNITGLGGKPEALAVDLVDDNAPLNASTRYILQLAAAAEQEGLVTGIRWGLPANLSAAIDAALAASDWQAGVKVGWDPLHVEPTGLTVKEARAGKRPT